MPYVKELRQVRHGWVAPLVLIIVLSFPPLFGNGKMLQQRLLMSPEIVMIVTGVVWGVRIGFAIAALGTLLGEMTNFM